MLAVDIPGFGALRLRHLVLDSNGTLALDGRPFPGVKKRLAALAARLSIHVLTADTFGKVRTGVKDVDCRLVVLAGAAVGAILASDLVVNRVNDALDLLRQPLRLVASLRN